MDTQSPRTARSRLARSTRTAAAATAALSLAAAGCSAGSLGSSAGNGGSTATISGSTSGSSGSAGGGSGGSGGGASGGAVNASITFLVDNSPGSVQPAQALATAFTAANPGIKVSVTTRPGGTDGDNLVKTRLSTGSMSDVFLYNSGSLFQQISPARFLQPLPSTLTAKVKPTYYPQVSVANAIYGVPFGTAFGGGVLYNRPIFAKLKLSVPKTWAEFIADAQKIKASGVPPVIQTYGGTDTWTSQLLVLGDYHNVVAENPGFAAQYTVNKAKFATTPAALAGFEHLQQIHTLGLENRDYASATNVQGLKDVATGVGAMYPMLSAVVGAIQTNNPTDVDNVGFFAIPGATAATNGLTTRAPAGLYVPTSTKGPKLTAVEQFLAFIATPAGCAIQTKANAPTGPYLVDGCTLPATVPQITKDVSAYYTDGKQSPALEFLSPVKGPNLENFTVEVGSGIVSAAKGASLYDQDVTKQAQQLGLKGW